MVEIGIITGTGFYELEEKKAGTRPVETPYGSVDIDLYTLHGKSIGHLSRHGVGHQRLPNMINYLANVWAFHALETRLIIGTTICGITNPDISLGRLLLFDDLYFPDNRLPTGEACTYYTEPGSPERGHYMFGSPFHLGTLNALSISNAIRNVTYGHVNGPRFNSKAEIAHYRRYCDAISQTSGPEAVLAGELEIPYLLLGFGVDYANGIAEKPTPVETLNENMEKSRPAFRNAIDTFIRHFEPPEFEGFLYRFE